MIYFFKSINLFVVIFNLVTAHDPVTQRSSNLLPFDTNERSAHISPEIINELKDFRNLIPEATVDEIIAEHYLIDGNFRTALKYLRSQEFTQLQKQLLDVPEIIDILEFLHLTAKNATTRHMGATKMPATITTAMASLDEFNDGAVADSYKGIVKMTNNTTGGSIITKPQTFDNVKEEEAGAGSVAVNKRKVSKRPRKPFYIKEKNNKNVGLDDNDIDDDVDETINANSIAFNEQQPLVHIVLLENVEVDVKATVSNKEQHRCYHEYKHQRHNSYHHSSVGTFTSFVEEVLRQLPNSAYQNMITEKCTKNTKFAQFYHSLRSPALKPFLQQIKTKPNIQKIITTLSSHDVDVNSLEPILFNLISWGPNI